MTKLKSLNLLEHEIVNSQPLLEDKPWNSLNDEEKKRSSKLMEIYAAMVSDLDQYIGNLVSYLKDIGEYENTFIFFLNGPRSFHKVTERTETTFPRRLVNIIADRAS